MAAFEISSFEYLPGIERSDNAFFTTLIKINSASNSSGVYELEIPLLLRNFILTYAKIPEPLIVFLPHFQGFHDLEIKPQFCPGSLAIQSKVSTENTRLDFTSIILCLAKPVD